MDESGDSSWQRVTFQRIQRQYRLLILMTRLWSAIQLLALAPAIILVADTIWGFWTPPVVFTRTLSLWVIFIAVHYATVFAFVVFGIRAKRYELAAEVARGMIIGSESKQPMVGPILEFRIRVASEIILKYGSWSEYLPGHGL
jgi:hypothetical protein